MVLNKSEPSLLDPRNSRAFPSVKVWCYTHLDGAHPMPMKNRAFLLSVDPVAVTEQNLS